MSKEKKNPAEQPVADLPKGFPPELIPLYDWWKKEGKSWLVTLALAGAIVAGFYGAKHWMHSRRMAASSALTSANTVDELEMAVAQHGSSKPSGLMKLRLAKSYYDAGRFQDAYDTYSKLSGSAIEGFDDFAKIGLAFSLEGLGKFDEAGKAFADFAADESNAKSIFLLTAKTGAARCKAQSGDKEGAVKDLEALKAEYDKDGVEAARIDDLIDACKRWEPRSLFDAANAAAAQLDTPEALPAAAAEPAPAAVVATPAVEKPAEAPAVEKPAEAPAEKPAEAPAVEKPAEAPAAEKPAEAPAEKPAEAPASK